MSATLMSLEVDNPPSLIKIVLNFEWEGESSLLAFRIRAHMSHSISGLHSPFFFFFNVHHFKTLYWICYNASLLLLLFMF